TQSANGHSVSPQTGQRSSELQRLKRRVLKSGDSRASSAYFAKKNARQNTVYHI
ncbi:hypothetical protein SARC_17012, partial [Sphaeroforma arctica JP610]